ncbi:MAG TPA: response regulator transcription factor [Bacillota bacterium]
MSGGRVLVVDDETEIRELIVKYLRREGIQTEEAAGGITAVAQIMQQDFDLVILDIMMDDLDGFEVLKQVRPVKPKIPMLLLSARQEDYDKVLGFGLGADDYVTKPFSPAELTARVKAHIRRTRTLYTQLNDENATLERGPLRLDTKSYTLTKNNVPIELSARELRLLRFFMENPGQVFTKTQIYRNAWENEYYDDNSVMVYISRLREKIEDNPREPVFIQTVWGIGYKFGA